MKPTTSSAFLKWSVLKSSMLLALFIFSSFALAQNRPSVTITAPAANANVSGKIKISANVTDSGPNAVKTIQFWINGSYANFPITKSGSVFSMDFDTATIPNGRRPITVVVFDNAANTNNATVMVTVNNATSALPDTTPPEVNFSAPTSTTNLSGTINVSATATDPGANASGILAIFFSVDGKRLSNPINKSGASTFNTTLDTKTLADGNHTLGIIVYDTALNSKTASLTINVKNGTTPPVDSTPPTVSFTAPTLTNNVSGTITISANATDTGANASGVLAVFFDVDGRRLATPISKSGASIFTTTLDTKTLADGNHTFGVIVYDTALNSKTASLNITVNNTPAPDTTAPSVSITSPANNAPVSGTINVNANASDNIGVVGVQFKVDGNNLGAEDTTSPYSVSLNTTTLSVGTHSLTAIARDAAGNTKTSNAISIIVSDTTLPTITISAPASGATVNGVLIVSATATDNVGVTGVQFKFDGVNVGAEDTTSPYTLQIDASTTTNGAHTLTAVARDAAGNSKTSNPVSITVNNPDTTKPTVSIIQPANNATVNGTITISALTGDAGINASGVQSIQFKVDGAVINNSISKNGNTFSTVLNTVALSNGAHAINITVFDGAGNSNTAAITITVNQTTTSAGIIKTVAGGGSPIGDHVLATAASLNAPSSIAIDVAGNVYIADKNSHRVRKVTPAGIITTVAGTEEGFSGDGGLATSAKLNRPYSIAVDVIGNLYIADIGNHRIRKVDTQGIITTIAGNGQFGFTGDGGSAKAASLDINAITVDVAGNIYIAGGTKIRKVNTGGIITTIAGKSTLGFSGDGGPGTSATFYAIRSLATDNNENLYIADFGNHRIRKLNSQGIVTTVVGTGTEGFAGDGGLALNASLGFINGIALDPIGNIYIADSYRIRKVNPAGVITTIAGTGNVSFSGDGGPAIQATFTASNVSVDAQGNVYIVDAVNNRIRKVDSAGTITTMAGGKGGGILATNAYVPQPARVALDAAGNFYMTTSDHRILKVDGTGKMDLFAGNAKIEFTDAFTIGYGTLAGDGALAAKASLNLPAGMAFDSAGNLYVADAHNHRIRKINTLGIITTVAGSGPIHDATNDSKGKGGAFHGDGGLATAARLNMPAAVAVDSLGNVYIADSFNFRVRKVDPTGIITTFAGNGGIFSGDGGLASNAGIGIPSDIALDKAGNVYITDALNLRVRKIDTHGIITTVAGNGSFAFSGDGGMATSAGLGLPAGIAVDVSGNLYITANNRIRKVDLHGIITTIAGTGLGGFSGDQGPATAATFNFIQGITIDAAGNIYVSDTANNRVRKILH